MTRGARTTLRSAAHHEAGHAVMAVVAFRTAKFLTNPSSPLIGFVEIGPSTQKNVWAGLVERSSIYPDKWPAYKRITWDHRDAMEWEITVYLAGGIAEAIYRGERRKKHVLRFAMLNSGCDEDCASIAAVLADLRKLTGRRHGEQRFAERALALLLKHWPAVEALALALIDQGHIKGDEVEAIIGPHLKRRSYGARLTRAVRQMVRHRGHD